MVAKHGCVWLSFRGPAVVFVVCFVASVGIAIEGPRAPTIQPWPDSWSEILSGATFIAAVAAVATYVLQLILQRPFDLLAIHAKIDMCDSCHRVKHWDSVSKCECGGAFDDFDKWTWVDGDEKGEGCLTRNSRGDKAD
jgi:hypothetical protein